MKKLIALILTAALALCFAGCRTADGEAVKLCGVEITDLSGDRDPVCSEKLSQNEIGEFLAEEEPWSDAEGVDEAALTPLYRVAIWQDTTQTLLGDDAPERMKIMEFVLYADTSVVKCSIGKDFLPEQVGDLLVRFQTAPQGFFDSVNALLNSAA